MIVCQVRLESFTYNIILSLTIFHQSFDDLIDVSTTGRISSLMAFHMFMKAASFARLQS